MLVLAFDTTAAACSVALVKDGVPVARERKFMEQGQAESLIPMIDGVISNAGLSYAALDRIAVTVGPGSFTGVRVGLSAARALGLAAGKPVVGVSSLEVVAAAVPESERAAHRAVVAAIDTKRGECYLQTFDPRSFVPMSEPVALAPAEVAAWIGTNDAIIAGDAAPTVLQVLPGASLSAADPLPDTVLLARLAAARIPDAAGPLPLYVLPPKITLAPHGGRLRP